MSASLRRDLIASSLAGLISGAIYWWALQAQDMMSTAPGLLGLKMSGVGAIFHLLVAMPIGAGFRAISRYQPAGYASTISGGLL